MARLKDPRKVAKQIAESDAAANKRERMSDPMALTRNSQLGLMDEEAQVMAVVGMVLFPEEFDTVLYAAPSTQDKMCKRGISQRYPAPWTNQPPASAQWLKAEEYFAASFRQVFRRFMFYNTNYLRNDIRFRLKHTTNINTDPTDTSGDFLKLQDGGPYFQFNIGDCRDTFGGSQGGTDWFTTTMVAGRSKETMPDARWVLCNAVADPDTGYESEWTVTPQSAIANECVLQLIAWREEEPVEVDTLVFMVGDTAAQTIQLTGANGVPDFMTWRYACDDADDGNFTGLKGFKFDFVSFCAGLTLYPVEQAFQNFQQLGPITVVAASVRLTEMAAPLNIQGEAAAACTRLAGTWMQMYKTGGSASGSAFTKVNNYRDPYVGPLKDGLYGWHTLFKETTIEMKPTLEIDYPSGILRDVWWDIEDDSDVNVFSARTTNSGQNTGLTGLGGDCWWTLATHMNWQTDNKWPDATTPPFGYPIWMRAGDIVRIVPRVMENHRHFGVMIRALMNLGFIAIKHAAAIFRIIGKDKIKEVAEHFLGRPMDPDGVKLLSQAYGIGNEITARLLGGGM